MMWYDTDLCTIFRNLASSGEFLMLGYFSVLLDLSGSVRAMGVN